MSLGRELGLYRRLRLDLAEENMSQKEVSVGGVRMVFEVLADGAVGFAELCLLEEDSGVRKRVLPFDCLSCGLRDGRSR